MLQGVYWVASFGQSFSSLSGHHECRTTGETKFTLSVNRSYSARIYNA